MEALSVIQQIAFEHRRRYAYLRISAELRRRRMLVNHKRVLRILREDIIGQRAGLNQENHVCEISDADIRRTAGAATAGPSPTSLPM